MAVIKQRRAQEKIKEKRMSREKKISLVLGDVAFYILKHGRPYTDFSLILNILSRAGVDIGDLNHSTSFVSNWAQVCAEVVD